MASGTRCGSINVMSELIAEDKIGQERRDQMLKLVSKGFYKELVNYGVKREEIIRVASHLLDNLITKEKIKGGGAEFYDHLFTLNDVVDEWNEHQQIAVQNIRLRPLDSRLIPTISDWLGRRGVRELFVPPFPESEASLRTHLLETPSNRYFTIECDGHAVGIVGGENIDLPNGNMEMKKLVGDADSRGKGIGKKATFAFLYYAFKILGSHKVYVHSRDINIRNINLNSKFGFILEGIFLEDLRVGDSYQDVVRMALFESFWTEIFAPTP